MDPPTPTNYAIGKVLGDEDSFLSSVAQCLAQVREGKFSNKMLRQECKRCAQHIAIFHNTIGCYNINDYIERIEHCMGEFHSIIKGCPDLEGKIISQAFNVNIKIIEKQRLDKTELELTSGQGNNEAADTIYIIQEGDTSFKPYLNKFNTVSSEIRGSYHAEMNVEDNNGEPEKYEKRTGTSGIEGQFYEIKLSVLAFYVLQAADKFYLASNMKGVEAFDDVIFKYYSKCENGDNMSQTVFLQAKHVKKQGIISLNDLLSLNSKNQFGLKKYLHSYQEIKRNFKKGESLIFKGDFKDCRFIIFTNYILEPLPQNYEENSNNFENHISDKRRWKFYEKEDRITISKGTKSQLLDISKDINQDIVDALCGNYNQRLNTQNIGKLTTNLANVIGKCDSNLVEINSPPCTISLLANNVLVRDEAADNAKNTVKFCTGVLKGQVKLFIETLQSKLAKTYAKKDIDLSKIRLDIKGFPCLGSEESPTEDEVKQFLSKLEFFVGQKKENELDDVIKNEIKKCPKMKHEDIDIIYQSVKNDVESWWRSDDGNFLTKETKFIVNAEDHIANLDLSAWDKLKKRGIEITGVRFHKIGVDELMKTIGHNQILNIVAKAGTTLLSSVKMCQTLEQKFGENSYIFTDINELLSFQDLFFRVFQSNKKGKLLLIESNSNFLTQGNWDKKHIEKLKTRFMSVINKDPRKNVIIISEQDDLFVSYFGNESNKFHRAYDTIHFNGLTDVSKNKMMNSEIKLHGKRIQMKDFIDIEHENVNDAVNAKMLMSFINNETLSISNAPHCLSELEAAFTKLHNKMPLENLVQVLLTSSETNNMFVISGINKPNRGSLGDELVHRLQIRDQNTANNLQGKVAIRQTIIIIPNQNSAKSLKEFQTICSTTTGKIIYWVEFTTEDVWLQQVYDASYYMKRKFNYKKSVALKLESILQKNPPAMFIFNDADEENVIKLVDNLQENYLRQFELNIQNGTIIFDRCIFEALMDLENIAAVRDHVYWLEINEHSKTQFIWYCSHGTIPDLQSDHMAFQSDLLVQENSPYLFIFSDEAASQKVRDMICASCGAKQQQFADNCKNAIVTFSPTNTVDENIGQHTKEKESKPVHWLKIGGTYNDMLIWKTSHGSLESLQNFIDKDRTEQKSYSEKDFIKEFRDKVVIIADEPGMGKTTSLTSVSQQMLDKNWVIRMNFLDCKHAIEKLPTEQVDLTYEDVCNFLSSVENTGLDSDSVKQLMLCKLDPKQTHCWPIMILFDGFDEIREEEQHKIILFLKYITHDTSAKVWVTTRLHKSDILENSLLVFATDFKELEETEQKEFLKRFWKVCVGTMSEQKNIDEKLEKYSSRLLDNASHILGQNIYKMIGTPLQLRILGEALKHEVANYLNAKADMEPTFTNLNTLYVYQQFIKEKYDIFVKDKMRINTNEPAMIELVLTDMAEKHEWYAIRLLFPKDDILTDGNEVSEKHENYVKSVGLIQSVGKDSSPYFIHRTFAEYFVSKLLVKNLCKKQDKTRYDCTIQFLLRHMFESKNEVIHNFMDRMLSESCPIAIAILDNKVQDLFDLTKARTDSIKIDSLGRTAMHLAAQEGHCNIVNILLDYGYDAVTPDALGKTALHYAVMNRSADVIYFHLLHHITDIDHDDHVFATPLHYDMEIGDSLFRGVKHLGSKLVTFVNHKDHDDKTAFQYAINLERGIACHLILHGANIGIVIDKKQEEFAIYFTYHCATNPENNKWLAVLGLLLIKWSITTEITTQSEGFDEILGRFINYGHTKVIEAIKRNLTNERHIQKLLSCNTKISYTFPISDEDHLKVAQYFLGECKNKSWISTFAQTAAQNGNLKTLKYIIEQEQVIDYNVCMLHAINGNQLNIVAHLYKKCSQYITHFKGDTALHLAAKYDRLDIVKYLVKNGADVNACNSAGKTPVQYAIESYAITIISYLSKHGATIYGKLEYPSQDYAQICAFNDINVQIDVQKNLPKLAAVCSIMAEKPEYDQVADFIISQVQHDINYANEHGTTLLHIASKFQSKLLAKYLIEHGADINIKDAERRTPLHIAVHAYYQGIKNHETVIYLLGQGAAYDEKDNSGNSVFAHFNHMETICDPVFYLRNILVEGFHDLDKLLQQGSSRKKVLTENKETNAAIYNAQNSHGNTLLHLAAESSLESFEKSFKLYDSDLEWRKCYKTSNNKQGNSPLHLAAASGLVQNATRLIKYGCPFNSRNNQNQTPVELARINSHTDVVDLIQLIEKTFNAVKENKRSEIECEICDSFPNATHEDGKTMLHWAAWNGHVDIAKALIKKESNVEANDKHGWKPLHYAAQNDQFKTVEFLLYHCAIFNPRNEEGKTPLEVATGRSVKFLDQINSIYNHFEVGNLVMASNCLKSICQTNNAAFNAAVQSCDNFGNTFLHYAAARNDTELVKFLLENGAPFDVHNKMMKYPIYLAHDKRIRKLLRGIERMFEWIYPPIHDIEPAQTSQQKITLCKNARDALGNTVLHAAVISKANHINCVRLKFLHLLIEDNFNINATNKQGCTPLDLAIMHSHFDFIRFLLKKGGKINNVQDEYIQKMLQKADAEGRPEIVDVCKSLQKL